MRLSSLQKLPMRQVRRGPIMLAAALSLIAATRCKGSSPATPAKTAPTINIPILPRQSVSESIPIKRPAEVDLTTVSSIQQEMAIIKNEVKAMFNGKGQLVSFSIVYGDLETLSTRSCGPSGPTCVVSSIYGKKRLTLDLKSGDIFLSYKFEPGKEQEIRQSGLVVTLDRHTGLFLTTNIRDVHKTAVKELLTELNKHLNSSAFLGVRTRRALDEVKKQLKLYFNSL